MRCCSKKFWVIVCALFALFLLHKPLRKLGHEILLRTSVGLTITHWLSHFSFYKEKAKPRFLRQEMVQMLYQTVKDVHDVFEACHLSYWIDFGTLLGAVRHGSFIPWDDDIDLSIRAVDVAHFREKCQPTLEALGYTVKPIPSFQGVTISPKEFALLPHEQMPGCDICFSERQAGGWRNKGVGVFIADTDLMPLRLYAFGPLMLWGPHNPYPSLDKEYGKNWRRLGEMGLDHHTVKEAQGNKKVPFIMKSFPQALPQEPLLDHRQVIADIVKEQSPSQGVPQENR